jgi:hypothetical protein
VLDQADVAKLKWTQTRMPYAYLLRKALLLRFAGITDEDQAVHELHRGFERSPELYLHLRHVVRDEGSNRLTGFRTAPV